MLLSFFNGCGDYRIGHLMVARSLGKMGHRSRRRDTGCDESFLFVLLLYGQKESCRGMSFSSQSCESENRKET